MHMETMLPPRIPRVVAPVKPIPSPSITRPEQTSLSSQSSPPSSTPLFQQKLKYADPISICGASGTKVGRLTMRKILTVDSFCVPIFQRRYCWTQTQWQTVLHDASKTSTSRPHSLGRLTCTRTKIAGNERSKSLGISERSCILDGQQRFTTTTILLAAIRDVWNELRTYKRDDSVASLDTVVNNIVFSDPRQMQAWNGSSDSKLQEGVELTFVRLVPTFCDRRSYYDAILPPSSSTVSSSNFAGSTAISKAKHYFVNQLRQGYKSREKLRSLLCCVLDGMDMLYFPIETSDEKKRKDDLMVIYERLAWRDATFCRPKRGEQESMSMGGADMIRNLLLGSFSVESDAVDFYEMYWLPMERMTTATTNLECFLMAFLEEEMQRESEEKCPLNSKKPASTQQPLLVGGKLYGDFQAWFLQRMEKWMVSNEEAHSINQGDAIRLVGQELVSFAKTYALSSN